MTAVARGRCVFGRVAGMKTAHASAGKDGAARGGAAGTAPRGMWLAVLLELSTLTVTQSCSQTLIQGVKEVHVPLKACVEVWIRNHPRAEGGRLSLRLGGHVAGQPRRAAPATVGVSQVHSGDREQTSVVAGAWGGGRP